MLYATSLLTSLSNNSRKAPLTTKTHQSFQGTDSPRISTETKKKTHCSQQLNGTILRAIYISFSVPILICMTMPLKLQDSSLPAGRREVKFYKSITLEITNGLCAGF